MTANTKCAYLTQIKNAMLFHFRPADIHSTLEDLSLLFDSGIENGKSEAELCEELGSPKDFVCTLIKENEKDRFTGKCAVCVLCGLILAGLLILLHGSSRPGLLCIPVLAIPLYFWFALGGNYLCKIRKSGGTFPKIWLIYDLLSIGAVLAEQIHLLQIYNGNITSAKLPCTLALALIIISAMILLWNAYRFYQGCFWSFHTLILAAGTIFSCLAYRNFHKHYSAPAPLPLYLCALPCLVGIGLTIVFHILSTRKAG